MNSSPLALPCLLALAAPVPAQENVLILLADDVGVDNVGAYAEGSDLAPTPNIDALAAGGVLFRNAWTNPVCSPTRACIQTGRQAFRHGVGMAISTSDGWALPLEEVTLPELLDLNPDLGYSHAAIGKWHLGNDTNGGGLSPNLAGYSHFHGCLGNFNLPWDFFYWPRWIDGTYDVETTYATTDTVDAAIAWISSAPQPWLCYVAFNAAHTPLHAPPPELHTVPLPPNGDPRATPRPYFKADLEAMDTEIGRLLAAIAPQLGDTLIVFAGDNGTWADVTVPPFDPDHAKLTCYEGGVNVPLIVSGPLVVQPGRESPHLVSLVDVFATVADGAGIDPRQSMPDVVLDSVSLVPYPVDPAAEPQRELVYTELFTPPGFGPYTLATRTMRGERYKLIWFEIPARKYELYDLQADPFEQDDLLRHAQLTPDERAAFYTLRLKIEQLLGNGGIGY